MTRTPLVLHGATGRMGRAIRACLPEFPELTLAACVAPTPDAGACPPGCSWMTPDELFAKGDGLAKRAVVIDVSLAAGTLRLLDWLERSPRPLVSATTGLAEAGEARIRELARTVPVLRARNLSVGNAVASMMLRSIPAGGRDMFQADVVEHHHAGKRDAPSGTALLWASVLGSPGDVRIHSIRSGDAVGTHRAILAGAGETIEIVHTVSDRAVFARGALRGARFLAGKPPALYSLEQTLENF